MENKSDYEIESKYIAELKNEIAERGEEEFRQIMENRLKVKLGIEEEKRNEEEWKRMPFSKKALSIAKLSAVILSVPTIIFGSTLGLICLRDYYQSKRNLSKYESNIENPKKIKETYRIQMFYDRGRELLTEKKRWNEQYSAIKDGIEYIKSNDSEDYNKLTKKVKWDNLDSLLLK